MHSIFDSHNGNNEKPLEDTDIISFGIHKGKALANVPADYLLYLYDNDKCNAKLKAYIESNLDVLKSELK